MNIAELSIHKKVIVLFITFLTIGGGILAYESMGRLEDPEFTIKAAKVVTFYPGASAEEVQREVTDVLETAIQQLPQLWRITSRSTDGMSIITPEIRQSYTAAQMPQIWDELRRKVGDAQSQLPPGVLESIVNDDFGDVFGVYIAITGEGYSYAALKDYADLLRRELLQVPGVANVALNGVQQEMIYIEISRSRIAQLGIPLDLVYQTIGVQNTVTDAGRVGVGGSRIAVRPSGEFDSVEAISNVLIPDVTGGGRLIRVRDIATVTRDYQDPPNALMRYNGKPAIGLGVSTVSGGNVVVMGELVRARLAELEPLTPLGMNLDFIFFQGEVVTEAINNFVVSLAQAIGIVIVVLLIFMGLRSGLIIGVVLLVTILATLIVMFAMGITLQRISLGALIIALGMLVDNAIVITDGILVRISRGMDRIKAAREITSQTAMPLLGATFIAVLAFVPIGFSPDNTGEYTRSLFLVMLISLLLSWITALTLTPLLCHLYLKPEKVSAGGESGFYRAYRSFLVFCIRVRYLTIAATVGLLVLAIIGFGMLRDGFFPPSTQPQFMVNYWLPQGADIHATSEDMRKIEDFLLSRESVTAVSSFVGSSAQRFQLTYGPEDPNRSFGQLIVEVDDRHRIPALTMEAYHFVRDNLPNGEPVVNLFELGPGGAFKVRARFSGPDSAVLRDLADQARRIMQDSGLAQIATTDWRQQVLVLAPQFSEAQARRTGIDRTQLSRALHRATEGARVGLYREGDDLIPIVSRAPLNERGDVSNLADVQIWSPAAEQAIPLRQVVSGFETHLADAIIMRRDRVRTIEAKADPYPGELASELLEAVKPQIEALELPPGYQLTWGGELENSTRAQGYIASGVPVPLVLMLLVLVMLFNNLRQPLLIMLTVPLAVIGVSVGLLLANEPFGFMALLGFLSLSGMLIKNAIVLIDEINTEGREGRAPLEAILNAGVSRIRPVAMAAGTTVLGMLPLFSDPFFVGMAVTIIGGLSFATLLTLIVVPVLHATFYRIPARATEAPPGASPEGAVA
jgi:multidrug efflux pump subunit AcrB